MALKVYNSVKSVKKCKKTNGQKVSGCIPIFEEALLEKLVGTVLAPTPLLHPEESSYIYLYFFILRVYQFIFGVIFE